MAHICPALTNNNPLFVIQRSVITIFGKFTGIGVEIMKFSCAYCSGWNYTLGDEWKKMEAVQLRSTKLAGCHQGNQMNCAIKLGFNEKLNSDARVRRESASL